MTVLVTGASGFLGGALTRILVERGERVRALVRTTSRLEHLDGLPIEYIVGDLSNRSSTEEAVHGASLIYHCAGLSSDWGSDKEFETANVAGLGNLLAAAQKDEKIERFIHVSTTDVYGYPKQACDETEAPHDVGLPYNRTKIAGERLVHSASREIGIPATIIRPVTIFGPRSPSFAIEMGKLLIEGGMPLIGGGRSQAGLIYVDDVAEAMITVANSPATLGQTYNLRDPALMTWRDYVSALAGGLAVREPRFSIPPSLALIAGRAMESAYRAMRLRSRPLLTRHAVLLLCRPQDYSVARAETDFGFEPAIGLTQGIDNTISWLISPEGRSAIAHS
jgi:nucleoside-diphosphate-sugar epimerase